MGVCNYSRSYLFTDTHNSLCGWEWYRIYKYYEKTKSVKLNISLYGFVFFGDFCFYNGILTFIISKNWMDFTCTTVKHYTLTNRKSTFRRIARWKIECMACKNKKMDCYKFGFYFKQKFTPNHFCLKAEYLINWKFSFTQYAKSVDCLYTHILYYR